MEWFKYGLKLSCYARSTWQMVPIIDFYYHHHHCISLLGLPWPNTRAKGLDNRHSFARSSRGWKPSCQLVWFLLRPLALACRWTASCSDLTWPSLCASCVLIFSSHKGTRHVGVGPTHMTSFCLGSLAAMSPNLIRFWSTGGLGDMCVCYIYILKYIYFYFFFLIFYCIFITYPLDIVCHLHSPPPLPPQLPHHCPWPGVLRGHNSAHKYSISSWCVP